MCVRSNSSVEIAAESRAVGEYSVGYRRLLDGQTGVMRLYSVIIALALQEIGDQNCLVR